MRLSIKIGRHYIYDNQRCELVAITSTNLGGWLKFRGLENGKEFVVHRKNEYLIIQA